MTPRVYARPMLGAVIIGLLAVAPAAQATQTLPPATYDVTTETGMPHLEENLRYTTTHVKRCLTHQGLASAFPILRHPALRGCRLARETLQSDTVSYQLLCAGGHGTTGSATWRLGDDAVRGVLNVKLGGKNMTFFQRVTAIRRGACQ